MSIPSVPAALATITPAASAAKAKAPRRTQQLKRRGAKVEEDEGEEEEKASKPSPGPVPENSDSEQSDFEAAELDEDDEDAGSDSDAEPNQPLTPATNSPRANTSSGDPLPAAAKVKPNSVIPTAAVHPSWADSSISEELPVLDFATLTNTSLASIPSRSSPVATRVPAAQASVTGANHDAAPAPTKKAAMLARRIAKSMESKAKDPVAWEVAEKERLERESIKKREKKERAKERRKQPANEAVVAPVVPTPILSSQPVVLAPPTRALPRQQQQQPVPARPSRTAAAGLLSNSQPPVASSSTLPPHHPVASTSSSSARQNSSTEAPNTVYTHARDAYENRLAEDPSFTPRIGRFWGHDERLIEPELRTLTPYWRGRGRGGELRGRGTRGRANFAGRGGMQSRGGWMPNPTEGDDGEAAVVVVETKIVDEDGKAAGWGRGESDRVVKPSIPTSTTGSAGWNHDGFEELKNMVPRSTSERGRGGMMRGAGRNGRGGYLSEPGTPGAINPRFAHLPFHPSHRFPALPVAPKPVDAAAPTPPPPSVETPPSTLAPIVSPVALVPTSDQTTTLPVAVVPEIPKEEPVAAIIKADPAVISATPPVVAAPLPLASHIPSQFAPQLPPHLQPQQQQQQNQSYPPQQQLPPHLLPQQSNSPYATMTPQQLHHLQYQPAPQYVVPRHASPILYYPQFYPPEFSTPSGTPPPLSVPPTSTFFAPPARSSRIEIKVPGTASANAVPKSVPSPSIVAAKEEPTRLSPIPYSAQQRMIPTYNGGGELGAGGSYERGGNVYFQQPPVPLATYGMEPARYSPNEVYYPAAPYYPQQQQHQQQQRYSPAISDPAILAMSSQQLQIQRHQDERQMMIQQQQLQLSQQQYQLHQQHLHQQQQQQQQQTYYQ